MYPIFDIHITSMEEYPATTIFKLYLVTDKEQLTRIDFYLEGIYVPTNKTTVSLRPNGTMSLF